MDLIIKDNKVYLKIFFIKKKLKNKGSNVFEIIDEAFDSFKILKHSKVNLTIKYDLPRFNYLTYIYLYNIRIFLKNYVHNINSNFYVDNKFSYHIKVHISLFKYIFLKVKK